MKNTNYETPIVAVSQLETADIVRTSPTSDTVESDANSFLGGIV